MSKCYAIKWNVNYQTIEKFDLIFLANTEVAETISTIISWIPYHNNQKCNFVSAFRHCVTVFFYIQIQLLMLIIFLHELFFNKHLFRKGKHQHYKWQFIIIATKLERCEILGVKQIVVTRKTLMGQRVNELSVPWQVNNSKAHN